MLKSANSQKGFFCMEDRPSITDNLLDEPWPKCYLVRYIHYMGSTVTIHKLHLVTTTVMISLMREESKQVWTSVNKRQTWIHWTHWLCTAIQSAPIHWGLCTPLTNKLTWQGSFSMDATGVAVSYNTGTQYLPAEWTASMKWLHVTTLILISG